MCAGDFQGITSPAAVQGTPQSSDVEPLQPETLNNAVTESEGEEVEESVSVVNVDPLDKFLPSPPKAKCSEELQVSDFCMLAVSNYNSLDLM